MFRRLAIYAVAALTALTVITTPALAGPGEGELLSLINAERSANGLPALAAHSSLATHARGHSAVMLADDTVRHSGFKSAASGWSRIGENVGRGPTIASLHYAFMSSPGHRKNILGEYSHAGVGTAVSDSGIVYATIVFMLEKGASASPTPTTTTPPATATTPEPTTTTAAPSGTGDRIPVATVRTPASSLAAQQTPSRQGLSDEEVARRLPWAAVAGNQPCTS